MIDNKEILQAVNDLIALEKLLGEITVGEMQTESFTIFQKTYIEINRIKNDLKSCCGEKGEHITE